MTQKRRKRFFKVYKSNRQPQQRQSDGCCADRGEQVLKPELKGSRLVLVHSVIVPRLPLRAEVRGSAVAI